MFPPSTERWRTLAEEEGLWLDPDFVLSVIRKESAGGAGKVAKTGVRGLMQVAKKTVTTYNQNHPEAPATWAEMAGKGDADVRAQVRVGCWYLRWCLEVVHGWDAARFPAPDGDVSDEQSLYGYLAYNMGHGAFAWLRQDALEHSYADTFDELYLYAVDHWDDIKKTYSWFDPIRFDTASKVLNYYRTQGAKSQGWEIQYPVPGDEETEPVTPSIPPEPPIVEPEPEPDYKGSVSKDVRDGLLMGLLVAYLTVHGD